MRTTFTIPAVIILSAALLSPLASAGETTTAETMATTNADEAPIETVARIRVPSTDALRDMATAGIDVTHEVAQGPGGTFDATVIVPGDELATLDKYDAVVLDTLAAPTQAELASELKGCEQFGGS